MVARLARAALRRAKLSAGLRLGPAAKRGKLAVLVSLSAFLAAGFGAATAAAAVAAAAAGRLYRELMTGFRESLTALRGEIRAEDILEI